MKKLLFTLLACFTMGAMAQEGLILHYDFVGDEGTTVSDKSSSHHDGTLKGSATVADGTVYLGNEDGYIDLGDLARHDFLYTGQSKNRRMYKVKDGDIIWRYDNADGRGEISDAVLTDDGHILIADQYGIAEVDAEGRELWRHQAPEGTEIHTIQPVGEKHVLYVQNGKPAKVVVMNIAKQKVVHEFAIAYPEKGSVHGQFRNARLTSQGTLLVANMAMGFVAEYNAKGKELHRWELFGPWSATELENGNILMVGRKGPVKEVKRDGTVVWETNTTQYGVNNPQKAYRLKNGNTVITNWFNEWDKMAVATFNPSRAPLQMIELTPDGHVAWEVSSWKGDRNLGPATTFQLLDEPVVRKGCRFGRFK